MQQAPVKKQPDFWLYIAFCALFFWAPLPLGSNRPWAVGLLALANALIALRLLNLWWKGEITPTPAMLKARWVVLLFWLIPVWTVVQMMPLPEGLLALVSPKAAAIYGPGWHPISVDVNAGLYKLQKSICYAIVFMLALQLLNQKARTEAFCKMLVISGVLEALYGALLVYGSTTFDILHLNDISDHLRYDHSAVGTYVNRNHFAGYLEMTTAIGIGLLIATLQKNTSEVPWRERVRRVLRMLLGGKAMIRLYLAATVIGIVLSHSRMGNTAFFASLGICGLIGIWLYQKRSQAVVILFSSLIVIDIFIVGTWFGVQQVAQRLEGTQLRYEGRTYVNHQAPLMIKDYPAGTGAGAFYSTFPAYRTHDISGFYDFTHNDYFQILIEYGLIGGVLFAGIVVTSLYNALQAQRERRTQLFQGVGFAAMMGITALLIHSWTDFNLHIPANASLFTCLCALAFVARYAESSSKHLH